MQDSIIDSNRPPFWLGLCGGAVGIYVCIREYVSISTNAWMNTDTGHLILGFYLVSLVIPVAGMICGVTGKTRKAGIVMAGCGILESFLNLFSVGILAGIFFIAGGFILYQEVKTDARDQQQGLKNAG